MSERFLYTIWNRLPFRFRQRLKQNVKRNMQEQYAESEQELYKRTEQFLLKQGKIILTEVMIGGLLLAVVLAWHIFVLLCQMPQEPYMDYCTQNGNFVGINAAHPLKGA